MDLLDATGLAGRQTLTLDAAGEGEALLVEVSTTEMLDAWRRARAAVEKTGRWPLLITAWGAWQDWKAGFENDDPFSRWFFGEEEGRSDVKPSDVIRSAGQFDVDAEIAKATRQTSEVSEQYLYNERDRTLRLCGHAPAVSQLTLAAEAGSIAVERHLLDWEVAHRCDSPGYQDWFVPAHPVALALLPVAEPWLVYAYVNSLYGTDHGLLVAAAKRWHQRYGAEPVASWGTMAQLIVARRPSDPDEALRLALEHAVLAPDTLPRPGIALRWHAHALMDHDRWFLHSGP